MIVHEKYGPLFAAPVDLPEGLFAYVMPLLFGQARLCVGDELSVHDAYDYADPRVAVAALEEFAARANAAGWVSEPLDWFRHVQSGRRRPDGDRAQEYIRE